MRRKAVNSCNAMRRHKTMHMALRVSACSDEVVGTTKQSNGCRALRSTAFGFALQITAGADRRAADLARGRESRPRYPVA